MTPQTLHPYAYAHNDPANLTDPTGWCGVASLGPNFCAESGGGAAAILVAATAAGGGTPPNQPPSQPIDIPNPFEGTGVQQAYDVFELTARLFCDTVIRPILGTTSQEEIDAELDALETAERTAAEAQETGRIAIDGHEYFVSPERAIDPEFFEDFTPHGEAIHDVVHDTDLREQIIRETGGVPLKVYLNGHDSDGNKVSIHWVESPNGLVYDVEGHPKHSGSTGFTPESGTETKHPTGR